MMKENNKINWKKRCLFLEEYIVSEFNTHVEEFIKWMKSNHPDINMVEIKKYVEDTEPSPLTENSEERK